MGREMAVDEQRLALCHGMCANDWVRCAWEDLALVIPAYEHVGAAIDVIAGMRCSSHRQQPQNDNRSDVLDPFLIVREPSMMHVHGQPPSGYPCSKLTYHIYGSMTEFEPVAHLCKR